MTQLLISSFLQNKKTPSLKRTYSDLVAGLVQAAEEEF